MPVSANITTSAGVAFTVPAGSFGFAFVNDSDTDIRYRLGATVATSGSTKGLLIAAGQSRAFSFKLPLPQDLQVQAIHAGSGSKTVTWDFFTREMAGAAVGEVAAVSPDLTSINSITSQDADGIDIKNSAGDTVVKIGDGSPEANMLITARANSYGIEVIGYSGSTTACFHGTAGSANGAVYAAHLTLAGHIGFDLDMTGGPSTTVGVYGYGYGPTVVAADENFTAGVSLWGAEGGLVKFTPSGDQNATNSVGLIAPAATGARRITLPDHTGTALVCAAASVTSPSAPNRTIPVVIGGTTYYLHAKTTND